LVPPRLGVHGGLCDLSTLVRSIRGGWAGGFTRTLEWDFGTPGEFSGIRPEERQLGGLDPQQRLPEGRRRGRRWNGRDHRRPGSLRRQFAPEYFVGSPDPTATGKPGLEGPAPPPPPPKGRVGGALLHPATADR